MGNVVKLKRKTGSAGAPSTSDIVVGELAVNSNTGRLYTKLDDNSIVFLKFDNVPGAIIEVPTGSRPGTSFTLSRTPTLLILIHHSIVLTQDPTPDHSEFTLTGNAITTGATIGASDNFIAVLI